MTRKAIILPVQPSGSHKVRVQEDVSRRANTVTTTQTTITTTATKIDTPTDAKHFIIKHRDEGITVWIGTDSSVTVEGSTAWPLEAYDELVLDQYELDNENSIYGIVNNGTVKIYCLGKFVS